MLRRELPSEFLQPRRHLFDLDLLALVLLLLRLPRPLLGTQPLSVCERLRHKFLDEFSEVDVRIVPHPLDHRPLLHRRRDRPDLKVHRSDDLALPLQNERREVVVSVFGVLVERSRAVTELPFDLAEERIRADSDPERRGFGEVFGKGTDVEGVGELAVAEGEGRLVV